MDVLPVAAQNGAPRFVVKELSVAINESWIGHQLRRYVTAMKSPPPIISDPGE